MGKGYTRKRKKGAEFLQYLTHSHEKRINLFMMMEPQSPHDLNTSHYSPPLNIATMAIKFHCWGIF
jgi:hypothetical protein